LLIGLFPELLPAGGVQRAGRQLAAVMQGIAEEHGLAILFLSLNDPSGKHELRVAGRAICFSGAGRSKVDFISAAYRGAHGVRLVLAEHPNLAPVGLALRAFHRGARCAVVAHGIEVWEPLPAIRRHALRRADLVLAPSNDTMEKVARVQGVERERIRLLPWSLDPEFPVANLRPAPPRPAGFPSGRVVLTVARLAANERYKGIDELIQVMPRLVEVAQDLHLAVVGDGDDQPRLRQLAVHLGIAERVLFLGSLEREDLIACYDHCDIFALPSSGEGFGLVFLEAMARGKPVVGGAHGGTPDIVEDGVTGFLVQHGDLAQLEDRIRRLLVNEPASHQMGTKALERVRCDFMFGRFSGRLTMLLADLLVS